MTNILIIVKPNNSEKHVIKNNISIFKNWSAFLNSKRFGIEKAINGFRTTGLILWLLKAPQNQTFSGIFRSYRKAPASWVKIFCKIHIDVHLISNLLFFSHLLWWLRGMRQFKDCYKDSLRKSHLLFLKFSIFSLKASARAISFFWCIITLLQIYFLK